MIGEEPIGFGVEPADVRQQQPGGGDSTRNSARPESEGAAAIGASRSEVLAREDDRGNEKRQDEGRRPRAR